jgi:hypothetical protein
MEWSTIAKALSKRPVDGNEGILRHGRPHATLV